MTHCRTFCEIIRFKQWHIHADNIGEGEGKRTIDYRPFLPQNRRAPMKKKILIVFWVILSFLIFTPSGIAKVYKYVDKNGIPHYTNVPTDPRYKPASGSTNQSPKKKSQKPVKKKTPDKISQR
jgi:hypothetical protein